MGNNLSCNEFYCQSIDNKPEWFSENNYSFFFYNNNNLKIQKPYKIDKGIVSLSFENDFHLFISKKLSSNSLLHKFIIPFNFFLNFPLDLSMYIILTDFHINLSNTHSIINILQSNNKENYINNNNNLFFIKLTFNQFNIDLSLSYPINKNYSGKIKNKKKYSLSLDFNDLIINNNKDNDNDNSQDNNSIILNKFSILFESNKKNILENNFIFDSSIKFNQIFLNFLFINKNSHNNKNSSFSFFLD